MTCSPGLCNNASELFDLSLRTTESAEPLLSQLSGTLVTGVAEQFDDTALVWGVAVE